MREIERERMIERGKCKKPFAYENMKIAVTQVLFRFLL